MGRRRQEDQVNQPQSLPQPRGAHIKRTLAHDAGAYARCSWCGRYSDRLEALTFERWPCDCGKLHGWSGSFVRPDENSKWSEAKR